MMPNESVFTLNSRSGSADPLPLQFFTDAGKATARFAPPMGAAAAAAGGGGTRPPSSKFWGDFPPKSRFLQVFF